MKYVYDKSAIMRHAHKSFKDSKRLGLGWTFARCLRSAWAAEKIRCSPEYQREYVRDWHDASRKRPAVKAERAPKKSRAGARRKAA